jgi:hypothetical protein
MVYPKNRVECALLCPPHIGVDRGRTHANEVAVALVSAGLALWTGRSCRRPTQPDAPLPPVVAHLAAGAEVVALGIGAEAAVATEGERRPTHAGEPSAAPTLLPPMTGEA